VRRQQAAPVIHFAGEKFAPILERTAPSSLEDRGRVSVRDLLTMDNIVARARGSIIHAWLEQIEWLEEGVPPAEQLRRIALTMARPGTDVEAELHWFNELLETPAMQNVLRRELYQPFGARKFAIRAKSLSAMQLQVYRERRFAVREGQRLLIGIIDRLVLLKERERIIAAEIIDFKTDNIAPDNPEQLDTLIERYRPQQEAYQQAIRQIYRLEEEQVSARLVFLRASQIHELVATVAGVGHGS
jgi:ATP-dependent exoDNAse (exonuclease V) beta subunit